MKRIFLAVVFLGIMACVASAEPINIGDAAKKLPAVNTGVAFSLADSKVNAMTTVDVFKTKNGMFSLGVGWAGEADSTDNKAIALASIDLFAIKNLDWPILEYISFKPGIYVGAGSINLHRIMESELDYGVTATVLAIKF